MIDYAVLERDGYRCVRCGKIIVGISHVSVHHRILGNRKDRRPSNLITLCGSGTTGCHGWVHNHPVDAKTRGWIVSRFARRDATPELSVWYEHESRWYLLGDNLTREPGGPLAA